MRLILLTILEVLLVTTRGTHRKSGRSSNLSFHKKVVLWLASLSLVGAEVFPETNCLALADKDTSWYENIMTGSNQTMEDREKFLGDCYEQEKCHRNTRNTLRVLRETHPESKAYAVIISGRGTMVRKGHEYRLNDEDQYQLVYHSNSASAIPSDSEHTLNDEGVKILNQDADLSNVKYYTQFSHNEGDQWSYHVVSLVNYDNSDKIVDPDTHLPVDSDDPKAPFQFHDAPMYIRETFGDITSSRNLLPAHNYQGHVRFQVIPAEDYLDDDIYVSLRRDGMVEPEQTDADFRSKYPWITYAEMMEKYTSNGGGKCTGSYFVCPRLPPVAFQPRGGEEVKHRPVVVKDVRAIEKLRREMGIPSKQEREQRKLRRQFNAKQRRKRNNKWRKRGR